MTDITIAQAGTWPTYRLTLSRELGSLIKRDIYGR